MRNIRIFIEGKVYKTGYRFFVKQMADQLYIHGRVQYLDDSIMIEAYGEQPKLEEFIRLCRIGNFDSKIKSIKVNNVHSKDFKSFEIKNTN